MSENKEHEPKKVLSLSGRGKLELKRGPEAASQVRQSFSHGRSKTVTVEVRTPRSVKPASPVPVPEIVAREPERPAAVRRPDAPAPSPARPGPQPRHLTAEEREVRIRALRTAVQEEERRAPEPAPQPESEQAPEAAPPTPVVEARVSLDPETRRQREVEELR